jgi:hypothetical protein
MILIFPKFFWSREIDVLLLLVFPFDATSRTGFSADSGDKGFGKQSSTRSSSFGGLNQPKETLPSRSILAQTLSLCGKR